MSANSDMNPFQVRGQSQTSIVFYWCLNGFVAVFCLILALALRRFVQTFMALFIGLGVELPGQTRFLMATCFWLLPLNFVGLAVLVYLKDLWSKDFPLKRLNTVRIFLAAFVMSGVVVFLLYLPIITIAGKLRDSK